MKNKETKEDVGAITTVLNNLTPKHLKRMNEEFIQHIETSKTALESFDEEVVKYLETTPENEIVLKESVLWNFFDKYSNDQLDAISDILSLTLSIAVNAPVAMIEVLVGNTLLLLIMHVRAIRQLRERNSVLNAEEIIEG